MIAIDGLTKSFGSRRALDTVSCSVPKGSLFGLVGHNGAGKSTLIGVLLGQVIPDAGTVRIDGHDVFAERARALGRVGAIYEAPAFYDYLSGERNLRILCEYTGRVDSARLRKIVEMVGLQDRIADRVGTYSHGMRQRLALAQALLPEPELLIFDEPAEGLDPEAIVETRTLLRQLHGEWGMTIVISSHHLSEMEQLCTHLAVMREGRVLYAGDWLKARADGGRIVLKVDRQGDAVRGLNAAGLVREVSGGTAVEMLPGVTVAEVARWLVVNGFNVESLSPAERTLESFYLDAIHLPQRSP